MLHNWPWVVFCLLASALTLKGLALKDVGYSPWHLANGRLVACIGAVAAVAAIAAGVSLLKRAAAKKQPSPQAALAQEQVLVPWPVAAGAGAVISLFSTLIAEDYARVLGGVAPAFFGRWFLAFVCSAVLLTALLRYSKQTVAFGYAAALLPALALTSSRWSGIWGAQNKILLCWVFWALFAWGIAFALAGRIQKYIPSVGFAFLFCAAAGGTTFLWCYNKVVYDPRTVEISSAFLVFLMTVFAAMAFAGLAFLVFLSWVQQHVPAPPQAPEPAKAKSSLKLFAALFCLLAAVWMLWWWAYRPGNMSSDSIHQWGQALGVDVLEDSHPILSSLLLTPFARLCASPALFTAFQVLVCAAVHAGVLSWWARNGLPRKAAVALAVLFALLPNLGIYSVTLWKDVWFCLGLFWLAFLFTRLIRQKSGGISFALETAVALVVVASFRHNGTVVAALSGLAMLAAGFAWRNKQVAAGVLAALALVIFIQGPLFVILGVPHYSVGLAGLGASSIGTAFTYNVDMPEDLEQMAEEAMPREDWEENYNPYHYFGYFSAPYTPDGHHYFTMFHDKSPLWVVNMWLRLFVRSPLVMFHERMAMCDSVVFVDRSPHPNAHEYPFANTIYPNDLGIAHQDTPLLEFFDGVLSASHSNRLISALIWRNGIWWVACLWLCYFNFLQKRARRNLYYIPMVGNLLTLLLALTEQGYRYTHIIVPYMLLGAVWAVMPLAFDDTPPRGLALSRKSQKHQRAEDS